MDFCNINLWTMLLVLLFLFINVSECSFKSCFKCRSRGDLGSCKDPFRHVNATSLEGERGIEAIPCQSGWCGKIIEGGSNAFKDEEYGAAMERFCLQRGPDDGEERCAPTVWGSSKVYMCFCQGNFCNAGHKNLQINGKTVMTSLTILIFSYFIN